MPAIPPLLIPYLDSSKHSLTLVTSTLGTGSTWLILQWAQAFYGTEADEGTKNLVIVSFSRNWTEFERKVQPPGGVEGKTIILDGTGLYLPSSLPAKPNSIRLSVTGEPSALEGVFSTIQRHIKECDSPDASTAVVIEGLDMLLSTNFHSWLDMVDLLSINLHRLRKTVHTVLVTLASDTPLISKPVYHESPVNKHLRNIISNGPTTSPLADAHTMLLAHLLHEADVILSIRPLDTGFARDVSGIVACLKRDKDGTEDEDAHEFLYFQPTTGPVKLWQRGTSN